MISDKKSVGWHLIMPLMFVTLYGSGFVGAKLGLPYAEPFIFLAWRFFIASILLCTIAVMFKASWPRNLTEFMHLSVAGLLMVATFSAGTFETVYLGISPAISALIIALQPILVALGANQILGEKITSIKWCGFLLGLVGVALIVGSNVKFNYQHIWGIITSIIALLGLTVGNLYQKRFCSKMNIFTGSTVQTFSSGCAMLVMALLFESMHVNWTGQFIFALSWMTIVVSIGALSILYLLIKHQEANQVASFFYLVPVSTAIISFFIYGETINHVGVLGMIITTAGIVFVNHNNWKGLRKDKTIQT
jgi:drug/metabolite transporter (DMT)-like permease